MLKKARFSEKRTKSQNADGVFIKFADIYQIIGIDAKNTLC